MFVAAEVLRLHLDYHAWASRRVVEAAGQLSPEELARDFGTADKSVMGTLVHIFGADRVWLSRLRQEPAGPYLTEADYRLEVLQNGWPSVLDQWKNWAAGWTDESVQVVIPYRDMKGRPWADPIWRAVLHVVNHGTHHRGQVAGFLRSMGRTPPPLDLIAYYRSMAS